MPLRTLVVVNPASRGGSTRKRFDGMLPRIRAALGECDVEWTRGPRDAERIAREAARAGVERIVVAGGDGTVSEAATGILAADLGRYAELAVLPLGTGGDLRRTLGVPGDLDAALRAIAAGGARTIDAGRVTYTDRSGRPATVFFVNIASFGISGLTTELVNRATKSLGGRASFLIGTLRGIVRYRAADHPVELRLDGEIATADPIALATAANGRWFGGGMHVAPDARPDDGLLDVVVIPGSRSSASSPSCPASMPAGTCAWPACCRSAAGGSKPCRRTARSRRGSRSTASRSAGCRRPSRSLPGALRIAGAAA